MDKLNSYKYYDTPEGEDCLLKLWYTTKYATLGALGISAYDIILVTHPQGYAQTLWRVGYWVAPFAATAAVFTAATCISTQIRKKDDTVNYMIGGALAGSIWGHKYKSVGLAAGMGFIFALAGFFKKHGIQNGWTFFPDYTGAPRFGRVDHLKRDYTFNIVRDPKLE